MDWLAIAFIGFLIVALLILAFGVLATFIERSIYRQLHGTTKTPEQEEKSALKRYDHLFR